MKIILKVKLTITSNEWFLEEMMNSPQVNCLKLVSRGLFNFNGIFDSIPSFLGNYQESIRKKLKRGFYSLTLFVVLRVDG